MGRLPITTIALLGSLLSLGSGCSAVFNNATLGSGALTEGALTVSCSSDSPTCNVGGFASNQTSITFDLACDSEGCSLECNLDSAGYSVCADQFVASSLTDGTHTLLVRVVSSDGTKSDPVSITWTTDTVVPTLDVAKLTLTTNPTGTDDQVTAADAASEAGATLKVYKESSLSNLIGSATLNAQGGATAFGIGDDQQTSDLVYAIATDAAGNTSNTVTLTNDATAPSGFSGLKRIISLSNTSVLLSWLGDSSDTSGQAGVSYDICQGTTAGQCASNFTADYTVGPLEWTKVITGLTHDQDYFFVARAKDAAGNRDTNLIEIKRQLGDIVDIESGVSFGCAVTADRKLYCWGQGNIGYLGTGVLEHAWTPVEVTGVTDPIQVEVGFSHACALQNDGFVKCWGLNSQGQLGVNNTTQYNTPQFVCTASTTPPTCDGGGFLGNVTQLEAGYEHTCALRSGGSVACWGRNQFGQIATGNFTSPQPLAVTVPGLGGGIDEIAAGSQHMCVVQDVGGTGAVYCWGLGAAGQLGEDGGAVNQNSAVQICDTADDKAGNGCGGLYETGFDHVAAGTAHTCAAKADNTLLCWGDNTYGQLGDGSNSPSVVPTSALPTQVADVDAGAYHTCFHGTANNIRCFGRNDKGQLGDGTTTDSNTPVLVPTSGTADKVFTSSNKSVSCSGESGGAIQCWGDAGSFNVIGIGNRGDFLSMHKPAVTEVTQMSHADAVSRVCARTEDGNALCWGRNDNQELGDQTTTNARTPVDVCETGGCPTKMANVKQIDTGSTHTCAVIDVGADENTANDIVKCWGTNAERQLGTNDTVTYGDPKTVCTAASVPPACDGGSDFNGATMVNALQQTNCALMADQTVRCWGRNGTGEVGIGNTTTPQAFPQAAIGVTNVTKLSGEHRTSCALSSDGKAKCWGQNNRGQIGIGNTTTPQTTPINVCADAGCTGDLTGITDISAGTNHACAVMSDGTLKCWGYNIYGQLGTGNTTQYESPRDVCATSTTPPTCDTQIQNVSQVFVGVSKTCVIHTDTTVSCWGLNSNGDLGDGTQDNQLLPKKIPGLTTVTDIGYANSVSCFVLADKTVRCVGQNFYGTIGTGIETPNITSPTRVLFERF